MKIPSRRTDYPPRLVFDHTFTTSSKEYFIKNGMQLAKSFKTNSGNKLIVYSEDDLTEFKDLITFKPLRNFDVIENFQSTFRGNYGEKLKFLDYSKRMDIWVIKIFAQLQFLAENPSTFSLYLDSDSYIRNLGFNELVNDFVHSAQDYDCGIFGRKKSYLHSETGFLTFKNSDNLLNSYRIMTESILSGTFKDLPSWTDCSLLDCEIQNNRISALDFCELYGLTSTNPIYESKLRKSFLHLKGARKGKFSWIKLQSGKYA